MSQAPVLDGRTGDKVGKMREEVQLPSPDIGEARKSQGCSCIFPILNEELYNKEA